MNASMQNETRPYNVFQTIYLLSRVQEYVYILLITKDVRGHFTNYQGCTGTFY